MFQLNAKSGPVLLGFICYTCIAKGRCRLSRYAADMSHMILVNRASVPAQATDLQNEGKRHVVRCSEQEGMYS